MHSHLRGKHPDSVLERRVRLGGVVTILGLLATSQGLAAAQESGSDIQELTVTGTRIRAPNLTSDSPVSAVNQNDIAQSNMQSVEGLLNHLPSVQTSITQQQSSLVGGTTANVNLRDLGVNRTLVLIDGHRIGPSDTNSAADLNFLPTTLLSGVDVMTGGASAVYGSDAVAGVINFHLIRDLQGGIADFSYSAAQHDNNNATARQAATYSPFPISPATGGAFDGFIRETSGIYGGKLDDGAGHITLYADYRSTSPVLNLARDWNICAFAPMVVNGKPVTSCSGSQSTVYGTFAALPGIKGNVINNPNGSATFVPFTAADEFNTTNLGYLQREDQRAALGGFGNYRINDHVEFYTELMYMNDGSIQQSPGGGLFIGGQGSFTKITVPCNNPFIGKTPGPLGVSQYTAIGCAAGVASVNIEVPGEHFSQPRQIENTHNDYRALAGLRGDIDGNWSYDLTASHWQSNYSLRYSNYTLLPLVNSALAGGTLNLFQFNGPTTDQQNAVDSTDLQTEQTREDDVTLAFTGDFGPYGGKSPWAANPVAVAGGIEYRHTTLTVSPDANLAAGNIAGIGGQQPAVNGGEAAYEEFAELRAPLVQDQPFVHDLNLNLGLRHTGVNVDNSSASFSNNTWKIDADYAPTADFRLRGGYNRAARSPDVFELFQPQVNAVLNGVADPCAANVNGTGPANPQNLAACTNPALGKAAVTVAQFEAGTIGPCNNNQCTQREGGNLNLKPEEADTWTWGVNVTPTFLPGFDASVDYWDVKVANYIGVLSGAGIVSGCYKGQTLYCQYVNRDPVTGSIGTGGAGFVTGTNVNLDSIHDRGIDVDLNYTRKIQDLGLTDSDLGALSFSLTGTYLVQAETQQIDVIRAYNCAGLYGPTCQTPQPNWRHQARVTWVTPWDADLSVAWRYIGGTKLDADSPSNPGFGSVTSACGGLVNCGGLNSSINAYNYIDLSASYKLFDRLTIRLGVNNLFDKDPPALTTLAIGGVNGTNNNTYTMYDTLGRILFAHFTAKL